MTVAELHEKLSEKFPKTLSCSWDNDGIMVSADLNTEVKKVLVALDASYEVIKYAKENGYDTVLTHHPMLFRGVKSVTGESLSGKRILEAVRGGVSVISMHTRMDAGDGGVNDALCEKLGFKQIGKFGDDEAPTLGRIAEVDGMSGEELAHLVKDKLGCSAVRVTGNMKKSIHKIALCGGDGKDFIYPALGEGCDAYITGDAGYNMAQDAGEDGLITIEVGHYHSEAPVCEVLVKLAQELAGVRADIYDSCAYRLI